MRRTAFLVCFAASISVWLGAAPVGAASQDVGATAEAAKACSVEGRVLSLAGEPLRKVVVTLEPSVRQSGQKTRSYVTSTDGEGRFSMTAVEPGGYRLKAERAGYLRQSYGRRGPDEEGAVITLTPGQRLTDVVLRLTPEASLAGRVVDEDGDPVGSVNVSLFRYSYETSVRRVLPFASSETDAAGAFKLTGVAPGRYYLVAVPRRAVPAPPTTSSQSGDKAEYSYAPTYYPGVADAAAAQQILLAPGESQPLGDLLLRKTRAVHVRGRVNADAVAQGPGRIVIQALPDDSRSAVDLPQAPMAQLSPEDGSFDLAGVAPGSYTLLVTTAAGRIKILGRQSVEVGNLDVNNVSVVLPRGVEVAGTIAYAGSAPDSGSAPSKPAPSPSIALIAGDPGFLNSPQQRVRDDSFDIPDVSPARYRVRVTGIPEDMYLKSISSAGAQDLIANDLDLTQGGGRRDITVTLSRSAARIDGSVQDADGHHLEGIVVTLAPRPLDLRQAHHYRRTASDQDGRFSMPGLAPGDHCLYLWDRLAPGDEFNPELLEQPSSQCHQVKLEENDKKSLDLTFKLEKEQEQQPAARPPAL